MRCTVYKVAPDDGLMSETCRASNEKINSNNKNFVHLVGLYTYCRMMHGAYNVKTCMSVSLHLVLSVSDRMPYPFLIRHACYVSCSFNLDVITQIL